MTEAIRVALDALPAAANGELGNIANGLIADPAFAAHYNVPANRAAIDGLITAAGGGAALGNAGGLRAIMANAAQGAPVATIIANSAHPGVAASRTRLATLHPAVHGAFHPAGPGGGATSRFLGNSTQIYTARAEDLLHDINQGDIGRRIMLLDANVAKVEQGGEEAVLNVLLKGQIDGLGNLANANAKKAAGSTIQGTLLQHKNEATQLLNEVSGQASVIQREVMDRMRQWGESMLTVQTTLSEVVHNNQALTLQNVRDAQAAMAARHPEIRNLLTFTAPSATGVVDVSFAGTRIGSFNGANALDAAEGRRFIETLRTYREQYVDSAFTRSNEIVGDLSKNLNYRIKAIEGAQIKVQTESGAKALGKMVGTAVAESTSRPAESTTRTVAEDAGKAAGSLHAGWLAAAIAGGAVLGHMFKSPDENGQKSLVGAPEVVGAAGGGILAYLAGAGRKLSNDIGAVSLASSNEAFKALSQSHVLKL